MRQLPAIDRRSWKQKRGISAPAASAAWSSVYSGGTSTSMPSTMSLVISWRTRLPDGLVGPPLRRHQNGLDVRVRRVIVDPLLDLVPEVADQALDGQAAASPSAQIVWPSIWVETSSSMSISRFCARPSAMRLTTRHIQPVPSRHGVHWPQLSCL